MNIFYVDQYGTISSPDEEMRVTRKDAYNLSLESVSSPVAAANEADACQPLAWMLAEIYNEERGRIEDRLAMAEMRSPQVRIEIQRLSNRLENMPAEPSEGYDEWIRSLSMRAYHLKVFPRLRFWLSEEPDMRFEDDYVDHSIFPQGSAMSYFESLPVEVLRQLGVVIVEGEYPGSSYYAAELRKGIDEANAAAEAGGLELRFVRKDD